MINSLSPASSYGFKSFRVGAFVSSSFLIQSNVFESQFLLATKSVLQLFGVTPAATATTIAGAIIIVAATNIAFATAAVHIMIIPIASIIKGAMETTTN